MSGKGELDPQLPIRYLLGSASEEESARLDELSIVDEEVAWRLRDAENDLLDAYARGELSPDELKLFSSTYLSVPARRRRATIAKALYRYGLTKSDQRSKNASAGLVESRPKRRWLHSIAIGWLPGPAFAAVVLVLMAGSGYLLLDNYRLHHQLRDARQAQANLKAQGQQLENELQAAQKERQSLQQAFDNSLKSAASGVTVAALPSFLLAPATRGIASIPKLSVPKNAHAVSIRLKLEVNDFSRLAAVLRDASNRDVWRSPVAAPKRENKQSVFALVVPRTLLASGRYVFELNAIGEHGAMEPLTTYPFELVIK